MKAKFLAHISQMSTADKTSQEAMIHLPAIYWVYSQFTTLTQLHFHFCQSFLSRRSIPQRFTHTHKHTERDSEREPLKANPCGMYFKFTVKVTYYSHAPLRGKEKGAG